MESKHRREVRKALDELKPHLARFIEKTLQQATGGRVPRIDQCRNMDIQALLGLLLDEWNGIFRYHFPRAARAWVHELKEVRNQWAHERAFTRNEADRAVDTVRQLARAIGHEDIPTEKSEEKHEIRERVSKPQVAGLAQRPPGRKRVIQRECMRNLYHKCGGDEERTVHEYAAAERRGDVKRRRNKSGMSAEAYARALLADGKRKGWL